MTLATGIRGSVRALIDSIGGTATLYPFSSATKTTNNRGEVTAVVWSSSSSVKAVSSNNYDVRRLLEPQGEESNRGDRVIYVKDTVTVGHRDRLDIDGTTYLIDEVKNINPIQNTKLASRLVLIKDEVYG